MHAIEINASGHWRRALESIEGTPADDWPPSPALQNLNQSDLPDGSRGVLLVGMAGKSHWSAAITADAANGLLKFDIACRAGAAPDHLGSAYRIIDVGLFAAPPTDWLSVCSPSADGQCVFSETPELLTIHVESRSTDLPHTFRWQYSIQLPMDEKPAR